MTFENGGEECLSVSLVGGSSTESLVTSATHENTSNILLLMWRLGNRCYVSYIIRIVNRLNSKTVVSGSNPHQPLQVGKRPSLY